MNTVEAKRIEQGAQHPGEGAAIDRIPLDILTWDGTERRRHPRHKVKWRGALKSTSSSRRLSIQVTLLDISEGGCCVRLDRSSSEARRFLDVGLQERFELTLFLNGAKPRIVVEVRWYIPIAEGVYGAGLEFISMTWGARSLLQAALRNIGS